jgi:hypothetical protein
MGINFKNFKTGRRVQIMLNSNPAGRDINHSLLAIPLAEGDRNPNF